MKELIVHLPFRWLPLGIVLVFAAPNSAISGAPGREQIARWVEQLGDNEFQRREEASQKLWEAGQAAESALEMVSNSADAEVARRARDILARFKWGIYPDTPKEIVRLINRYQNGDRGASGAIIKELFENGAAGCRAVLKISRAEEDPEIRRRLFAQISNEMSRAVPLLLAEDHFDTLSLLVETALDQDVRSGVSNYAAFWMLRGKLDERIACFQARAAKNSGDAKAQEILAYLYRANGSLPAARAAAEKAGRADLVEALLVESGAWKELATRPIGSDAAHDAERLGLRAAYCRLAEDSNGLEKAIAALRKLVPEGKEEDKPGTKPKEDDGTALLAAKALFLNDRPADALEILIQKGDRALAFEVMVARMQFREAFKLVDAERAAIGNQLPELEILEARTLCSLGHKDKALPVFARYGELLTGAATESWSETLVEAELRVGLTDQALRHAAKVLSLAKEPGRERHMLQKLFPKKSESAEVWWGYLRQGEPTRESADILKQVAEIMRGKMSSGQAKDLVAGAEEALKSLDPRPDIAERWTLAMADVALSAGDEALARTTLEKSAATGPLQKLGDLLAEKKQWDAAAERYRRAWEADRQKPLPLFLWGRALSMAGQAAAGERRMEQSHWLPLGNEEARFDFVVALAQRGQTAASRREKEILLHVSQPASYFAGEAQRRVALEAHARQDYLPSARGQELAMLRCLRNYITFVQAPAYVAVPGMIHRERARGLLASGRIDGALQEASLCLEEIPGDVDVPVFLVSGLENVGRKKDADALFNRAKAVLDGITKEFPKCAWAHNSSAWLAACCRRDLDAGLAHAQKAIEMEPGIAGFYDTLAEVCIQRGEKDKAIAAQKKAIELDPKKVYYRKQLKRMEAGDPSAARPPEDEGEEDD
jgi:tetratricopeptide (TPR) repeat protein